MHTSNFQVSQEIHNPPPRISWASFSIFLLVARRRRLSSDAARYWSASEMLDCALIAVRTSSSSINTDRSSSMRRRRKDRPSEIRLSSPIPPSEGREAAVSTELSLSATSCKSTFAMTCSTHSFGSGCCQPLQSGNVSVGFLRQDLSGGKDVFEISEVCWADSCVVVDLACPLDGVK